jgi:DNA-binding LytR/AlgR family response regulator
MKETTLQCLIVEDEPIAAEILEDYIQQVPFLHLSAICTDALYAMEKLKAETIHVLFLDIHLPKLKGLDFLRTLSHPPQTILTTAYHEYALDAFEEGVVDYLMKPIAFPRFLKAVNKLDRKVEGAIPPSAPSTGKAFHFFNVNKRQVKVFFDEVLYLESLKDYTRIVTPHAQLVTRGQVGEMERLFRPHGFLRIHRSYLINLNQIKSYAATGIEVEGKELPIGRSYKELVAKQLEIHFRKK